MFHDNFFDLVSFLYGLYDRLDTKTVNINHVFQVKKESTHIGYRRYFYREADSEQNHKKDNTYRNVQSKRRIRNIFKHLNQIEKPKIGVKKRITLAKFRRFLYLNTKITGCTNTRQQIILNF